MRNKFDNFLLGLLWILVSTLGLCFWFNIQFGFNLLSASHWQHLSYMQATRAPITPAFYISLVIGVFFIIFGLYLLIRPKFRKIQLPSQLPEQQTIQQPTKIQQPTTDEFTMSRPKRLMGGEYSTAPVQNITHDAPPTAPVVTQNSAQSQVPQQPVQSAEYPELKEIFESTGYTIKKAPRILGYQTALLAIGTSETVWIGAVGIETSTLQSIIDSITQVFSDTLEDITITTHGFVIAPSDADAPSPNILTFATVEDLRNYMQPHPNPPLDTDMAENFDAFSEYISTVMDYIGHL